MLFDKVVTSSINLAKRYLKCYVKDQVVYVEIWPVKLKQSSWNLLFKILIECFESFWILSNNEMETWWFGLSLNSRWLYRKLTCGWYMISASQKKQSLHRLQIHFSSWFLLLWQIFCMWALYKLQEVKYIHKLKQWPSVDQILISYKFKNETIVFFLQTTQNCTIFSGIQIIDPIANLPWPILIA